MRRQSASDTDDTGTASSSGKPEVVLIKHRVYGLMLDSFTPPGEACFIHGKGRMSLPGIVLAAGKAIEELVRALSLVVQRNQSSLREGVVMRVCVR